MRVWVTRDEPPDGPLCEALRSRGLTPICEPVIQRRQIGDARREIARLCGSDWLVLTSAFAVSCLALPATQGFNVAAVGPATAEAAERRGLEAHLIGERGADELFRMLRRRLGHGVVCYPRSSAARPPEEWKAVTIISPVVYETTTRAFDRGVIDRVEIIAATSPSAARSLGRVKLPVASIGPSTTAALLEIGVKPCVEARAATFSGLAEAIAACVDHLTQ